MTNSTPAAAVNDVVFQNVRLTAEQFAKWLNTNVTAATTILGFLVRSKAIALVGKMKTGERGRQSNVYEFPETCSFKLSEFIPFENVVKSTKKSTKLPIGAMVMENGTIIMPEGWIDPNAVAEATDANAEATDANAEARIAA